MVVWIPKAAQRTAASAITLVLLWKCVREDFVFARMAVVCAMRLVWISKQTPNIAAAATRFVEQVSSVREVCVQSLARPENNVVERRVWTQKSQPNIAVVVRKPVEVIRRVSMGFVVARLRKKIVVECVSMYKPTPRTAEIVGSPAVWMEQPCVKAVCACLVV
jgi:hypothetical protein